MLREFRNLSGFVSPIWLKSPHTVHFTDSPETCVPALIIHSVSQIIHRGRGFYSVWVSSCFAMSSLYGNVAQYVFHNSTSIATKDHFQPWPLPGTMPFMILGLRWKSMINNDSRVTVHSNNRWVFSQLKSSHAYSVFNKNAGYTEGAQ